MIRHSCAFVRDPPFSCRILQRRGRARAPCTSEPRRPPPQMRTRLSAVRLLRRRCGAAQREAQWARRWKLVSSARARPPQPVPVHSSTVGVLSRSRPGPVLGSWGVRASAQPDFQRRLRVLNAHALCVCVSPRTVRALARPAPPPRGCRIRMRRNDLPCYFVILMLIVYDCVMCEISKI